jgi:hypothetical protein
MIEVIFSVAVAALLFGITWKRAAPIGVCIGAVISALLFYFFYPPMLLMYLVPIFALFLIGGALMSPIAAAKNESAVMLASTIGIVAIVLVCAVVLLVPIISAGTLYHIPRVDVVQGTTAAISPEHIRIVSEGTAIWRAEKLVGGLGYKEDSYDCHVQSMDGDLAWLCPYDFNDPWAAFWYGGEGVSGYAVIDAENPYAEPVLHAETRMIYTPNTIFNNKLIRHIYFDYPSYYIKEPVFHIDDKGGAKWVTMLATPTVFGVTGEVPSGIVITDPETGRNDFYYMDEAPSWVKRTWSESTVENYLDWWGAYGNGFWNTIFGQRDMKVPTGGVVASENSNGRWEVSHGETDVFLIMGIDNRLYWYTSYSTEGNRNSMVGYMLVDVLTGKFVFHEVPGTYNDLSAAKNVQQHSDVSMVMGHHVTQPIMYVMNGDEVWIIPVVTAQKENAGIGIVRAKDGETFYGKTLDEALAQYRGDGFNVAVSGAFNVTGKSRAEIISNLENVIASLESIVEQLEKE